LFRFTLLVVLLSLAGLPPLVGFLAKAFIMAFLAKAHFFIFTAFFVFNLFSLYFYLQSTRLILASSKKPVLGLFLNHLRLGGGLASLIVIGLSLIVLGFYFTETALILVSLVPRA
jgi:NADH:ubiquinone oxidoreductase subunit 2 (subunit N)